MKAHCCSLNTTFFVGLEDDKEFPVEILPYLFLGNAANSEDSQALARHSIQVGSLNLIVIFVRFTFGAK